MMKPMSSGANSIELDPVDRSSSDFAPAAPIAGTLSRNDQRAAVARSMPENKPALIVIPEREVPGIKARICASPITIACHHLMSLI